jgi:hypothetical protein
MKKEHLISFLKQKIDLPLLLFLVFFFDVKIVVKLIALVFIILYDRNRDFGLSWKRSRLPLFYFLIIVVELLKYVAVTRNYSLNYLLVFSMGILQWGMCLLAIHHVKLGVDRNTPEKMHNTIRAFFGINALVSFFFLALLIFHPAWLTYWGHGTDLTFFHPSAGDAIIGVCFDASSVNATLNCLGLLYFLYKGDLRFALVCIVILALCTSNVAFLFTICALLLMILTVRQKRLRKHAILATLLLGVTYTVISPSNRIYLRTYFTQLYILNKNPELIDSAKATTVRRDTLYAVDKGRLTSAADNLLHFSYADTKHGAENTADSSSYPQVSAKDYLTKPGKFISFLQTGLYLISSPGHLVFGSGVGNFSSKLAFRASGVRALGSYPAKYTYTAPEFRFNHLKTYLFYNNMEASKHSVVNYPYSVYNQLLGEYGLVGGLLFAVFYLGYFLVRRDRLSYGRYMLVVLLGFFAAEYWFEFFSLIVLFELFMLLNIKEGRT